MAQHLSEESKAMIALCDSVKQLTRDCEFTESEKLIADAMRLYPHAPQPHNLMGVLLETMHDHIAAVKHFRAAWSLDPTYLPARHNLNNFASFYPRGKLAYDEHDCLLNENK